MPKPLGSQWRWRVKAQPAEGSRWTRLGRDHFAQSVIWATFIPERGSGLPTVRMLVGLDGRNIPQVRKLAIDAGDAPLTPTSTRLPLRGMTRAAVACLSYRLDGDTVHLPALPGDTFTIDNSKVMVDHLDPSRLIALEQDARMRPRRKARTGQVLDEVAAIVERVPYRERRSTVMRELDVSYSTAKSLIAQARKEGRVSV